MVLTKSELIDSLQHEVNILLHLGSKIEPEMVDYRPTPKQRSTLELLQYLTYMGPEVIRYVRAGRFDGQAWQAAIDAASRRDFKQTLATLEEQKQVYKDLLADMPDESFREEVTMFARTSTRGSLLVNLVLGGHAAYRTQLFLYLKACGREELSTLNLWAGVDALPADASKK
jgi:hypothetical protein